MSDQKQQIFRKSGWDQVSCSGPPLDCNTLCVWRALDRGTRSLIATVLPLLTISITWLLKQAMAAGSAVALPTLEAIRALSHPRAGYSTKALESAELLVSGFVADNHNDSTSTAPSQGSQAIAGVGVIVVRWVINVINGVLKRAKDKDEKAGDTTEARRALENVRLWKVSLRHPMLPPIEIACLFVWGMVSIKQVLSSAIKSISEGKSASGAAGG